MRNRHPGQECRLYRHPRRSGRGGFVLLEVIVSLVILGVAIATLMRSFTLSMNAIRKNDVMTQSCLLAQDMIEQIELNPPQSESTRGAFEDIGFPQFGWEIEYTEDPVEYRNLKTKSKIKDLRPLRHATLRVTYDDQRNKKLTPVLVDLYLPPIERFNYQSKFMNELFKDEKK
ncbi:MAG: type II secretion system protein [bacterium]